MSLVELMSLVPPGKTRLFPRKAPPPHSERFFGVHMAWEYAPARLDWHNEPEFGEGPRRTGLFSEGVSVTTLERPQLTFDGPRCDLIDFYTPKGGMAALLSMRLFEMIEALDPGSIESIPAMVRAMGAIVPYRFTMPTRSLYAVDVDHTDVLVKDTDYAGEWLRSVEFPSGIAFRDDLPAGAYSFAERCLPFWYWSRELIDAFRDAGMRGIYTHTETAAGSKTVDRI